MLDPVPGLTEKEKAGFEARFVFTSLVTNCSKTPIYNRRGWISN
jgi:hypothetical protein